MLRWVIWLLVLANGAYFAWSQGFLAPLGFAPYEQREPERLQNQIRPEAQRLLNPARPAADLAPANDQPPGVAAVEPLPAKRADEASTAAPGSDLPDAPVTPAPEVSTAAARPAEPEAPSPSADGTRRCWQAGVYSESQANTLKAALASLDLPDGSWQLNETRSPGRWIVYMGRYDNAEQLSRKKTELRELNVSYREVNAAGLSPGLALGTFSSEEAAEKGLNDVARAGVRTAQVVQERAESRNFMLRLPAMTAAERIRVEGLGEALAGKPLQACK